MDDKNAEATLLGKRVDAITEYKPEILVKVDRKWNRTDYGIVNSDFYGEDEWRAYECSALQNNGLPVYFGVVITYSCHSKYIVESKSLKLYLNSFNMWKIIGESEKTVKQNVCDVIKLDLMLLLDTNVDVEYFDNLNLFNQHFGNPYVPAVFKNLLTLADPKVKINAFKEAPEKLQYNEGFTAVQWQANILRSNCKVTNQPDWGQLFLKMDCKEGIDPQGFIEYLVSFRDENHFHEEVCEMIYKRLQEKYNPSYLMVKCLYTRRGGIDINPIRHSNDDSFHKGLKMMKSPFQ